MVLLRILAELIPHLNVWVQASWSKLIANLKLQTKTTVFDNSYIESKAYFLKEMKELPSICYISNVDVQQIFVQITDGRFGKVLATHQQNWYNWQLKRQEFSRTLFKLSGKIVIELGNDYAEVLYDKSNYPFANNIIEKFKTYKAPAKEQEYEINIITLNSGGLELKPLAIKPTALDIELFYNDDFKAVDRTIKERLEKQNDKGIILLHGLPGTGKTTYLRHLIGSLKKRVLFVSPAVAANLMNPEFIDLLIDNTNCVLVIEDAENIILDRKYNRDSSVSNLLNISDGLLSDCLNVQVICTFNSALHLIDSALLRKGRLIAKYEFGKLEVDKAKRLCTHLGKNQVIEKPMTLAEISHPEENYYSAPRVQVIGFRREEVVEN
jgi:hypothetical protein